MATDETVAAKPALAAPAATVTDDGTVTDALLLVRLTACPPVPAAAFSVTVQLSVPAPVIDPLVQLNPLGTGCPVPLRPMVLLEPVDELLVSVTVPLAAPPEVGENPTVSVAVWPGFNVSGKLTPDILKPAPVSVPALMVSAAVPDEVRVTVWLAEALTFTVPKLTLPALNPSVATAAPRLME